MGYQPWYDHRHDVEKVTVAADMAAYDLVNTNYWLYGHQALTEVTGMGNLGCVREMRHTFNSCTGSRRSTSRASTRRPWRTSPTPSAGAARS